jgi:predicted nucleic acid-binding protein
VYILDTCILNILFCYPGPKREALERNLSLVDKDDVWISAISAYELVGVGAVKEINNKIKNRESPHRELETLSYLINKLSSYQILPYTEEDEQRFISIPPAAKREGPMDCRIAASALTREDAIVVTEDEDAFELAGATCVD